VSCLPKNMMSINAPDHLVWQVMQPVTEGEADRETTVFYANTADDSFGIYGTFDQLLTFAQTLTQVAYSWVLLNDRTDWLGEPIPINGSEVVGDGPVKE
jgi:hypothetical protein